MKLGQILTSLLILAVAIGGSYIVFFDQREHEITQFNASHALRQSVSEVRKADDPTYGQEVRSLTAQLKRTQDRLKEKDTQRERTTRDLNDKIRKLNNQIESLSKDDSKTQQLQNLVKALEQTNTNINEENEQLKEQLTAIAASVAALESKMQSKDDEIESLKTAMVDASNNINLEETAKALFASQMKAVQEGHSVVPEEKNEPKKLSANYQPYNVTINESGKTTNLAGLLGKLTDEPSTMPLSNTGEHNKLNTVFPVYTLPVTTILSDATLITPLIARVPFAGNVNDPFKFQLELGAENLAANGHSIPGVHKALVAGIATGVREQSCARGKITAMTFIFEDGRIHTVEASSGDGTSGGLGYLADSSGKPCISGQYINNAGSYLTGRSFAAFLSGLANAYSASKVERVQNANGTISSYVTGNAYEFAAAQGISGTADEIANYVRERALDAFDVIYVPQAANVQIFLEKQINIDYDLNARKTNYLSDNSEVTYD